MPDPVRIVGHWTSTDPNEYLQAQVDSNGNLQVREGVFSGLNKTYEDTSFVEGDSPVVHDFYADSEGKHALDGYIICDGAGNIQVDYTKDGVTYGDKWTMKSGEKVSLTRLNIKKIRITWVTDSSYRINLV